MNYNKIYSVNDNAVAEAEALMEISFPSELKRFYEMFGYGFLSGDRTKINRILDPMSVADLRLRVGDYEHYEDLDLYKEYEDNKLLFFEANEGIFFSIEMSDYPQQKVYFCGRAIADSLEEFVEKYTEDNDYFEKSQIKIK